MSQGTNILGPKIFSPDGDGIFGIKLHFFAKQVPSWVKKSDASIENWDAGSYALFMKQKVII